MAYPFYPYQYYPATYQPQIQQTQMPQQTQPIPQSNMIWVSGEREASMYPVAPNNAVTLWSQSENVVYVKSADATGKPILKAYDLVERTKTPSDATSASGDNLPAYATKDELSAVVGAVKGIDGLIASMKSEIDTMKSDMYGIAGKKKVRKPDADAE